MKKILTIGPIFIILASLLWSFDGLLRTTLYILPPSIIVFWEHLLGLLILSPFFVLRWQEVKKLSRKEWIAIIFVSLFSGALGTILYTAALGNVQYIQYSVVVLLQQLQPIWAIITAHILLREKLHKKFVMWAVIAIIASYFVTFKDLHINISTGNSTLVAALFALLAGMMWATSTSFSKIVLQKVSFITTTFLRFLFAPFFALLFALSFHQTSALTQITSLQWFTLLIITFSTGLVALLIYYFGLRKTPARISAICELTWPASAVLIDFFYLKKGLSITQLIGVVVILFAIYKISKFKK